MKYDKSCFLFQLKNIQRRHFQVSVLNSFLFWMRISWNSRMLISNLVFKIPAEKHQIKVVFKTQSNFFYSSLKLFRDFTEKDRYIFARSINTWLVGRKLRKCLSGKHFCISNLYGKMFQHYHKETCQPKIFKTNRLKVILLKGLWFQFKSGYFKTLRKLWTHIISVLLFNLKTGTGVIFTGDLSFY